MLHANLRLCEKHFFPFTPATFYVFTKPQHIGAIYVRLSNRAKLPANRNLIKVLPVPEASWTLHEAGRDKRHWKGHWLPGYRIMGDWRLEFMPRFARALGYRWVNGWGTVGVRVGCRWVAGGAQAHGSECKEGDVLRVRGVGWQGTNSRQLAWARSSMEGVWGECVRCSGFVRLLWQCSIAPRCVPPSLEPRTVLVYPIYAKCACAHGSFVSPSIATP